MSSRRAPLIWLALLPLLPAPALAQVGTSSAAERAREADMFGLPDESSREADATRARPDDAREADMFGSPAEDAREADMFGAPAEDAREADMFGEPVASSTAAVARDDRIFGGEAPRSGALDRMEERLGITQDTLAIGGQLWLWAQYAALSEGALKSFRLSSPSFMDVYLDARPNDRVRAYAQGRLTHDLTVGADTSDFLGNPIPRTRVLLDQLWMKFDIARTVFVTAGRQRIRWGAGRFWNPTDFLNQTRLDPLAFLDLRLGVGLLKLHVPVESLGWNFYGVVDVEGADALGEVGGALRAEFSFAQAEVSASVAARKDQPLRLGVDASAGVWLFDLRAELAVQHGVKSRFFRGMLGFDPIEIPEQYSREDDWIPQLVLGGDITIAYSDEDSVIVGVEYFYNDAGYSSANLYPVLLAFGEFTPLYLGQHYGAAYVALLAPGDWDDTTFTLSALGNLSDRSFLSRIDYRVRVLTYLQVAAFGAYHFGTEGELRFGLDLPAVEGAGAIADATGIEFLRQLENGLRVPPPRFEVGIALSVSL